jgi:DNA-binding IclR family transcriptional regulator
MMTGAEADKAVLAALRANGPGTITVKRLATAAGVARVTARSSVAQLAVEGLVCALPDYGETAYMVRHLHVAAGECTESLRAVIQEIYPDR